MNAFALSCTLVLLSLCNAQPFSPPFSQNFHKPSIPNTIAVTGSDMVSVETTISIITLGVDSKAKSAAAAQAAASAASTKLLTFLRGSKVSELSTNGVSLFPNQNFNTGSPVTESYTANSMVTFEVAVKDAGTVLDGAVTAGATRIDNLLFKAVDAVSRAARAKAIRGASAKARFEAKIAAVASGKRVGKIINIQVVDVFTPQNAFPNGPSPTLGKGTKIFAQKQQIGANVMLTFRIY